MINYYICFSEKNNRYAAVSSKEETDKERDAFKIENTSQYDNEESKNERQMSGIP